MKKTELLSLALLEGGLVMLLETSSPLIVAPILGHSVIIWATMICISIGALAIGYFLGGFLSRENRDESFVINLFGLNSLMLFIGLILLYLQNYSSIDLASTAFTWTIVFVILFFPLVLFGASTPIIVSVLHNSFSYDQSIVGRVFSISTIGGVCFSLITGYWLIPSFGLSNSILIGLLLTSFFPLKYAIKERNHGLLTIVGISAIGGIVLMQFKAELPETSNFKTQYFSESINGQLVVADFEQDNSKNRILFINRMGQTWINMDNNTSVWPYVNAVTCISHIYPEGSKSLVLGLGGGILPKQLNEYCGHRVDAVEIDQRIIDISRDYFDLSGVNAICDDARRYVKTTNSKYEFVVMDIFNGEILPSHGLSKEAFEDIKMILKPNGMIVINFNGFLKGVEGLPGRSLIKTLEAAGFQLRLVDASMGKLPANDRNILFVAFLSEPDWSKAFPLTFGSEEFLIGDNFLEINKLNYEDGIIITDDKPLMEYINRYAARNWRETYLKNFTLKFKKSYQLPFIN